MAVKKKAPPKKAPPKKAPVKKKAAAPKKAPPKKAPPKKAAQVVVAELTLKQLFYKAVTCGMLRNVRGDFRDFDEFQKPVDNVVRAMAKARSKYSTAADPTDLDLFAVDILSDILGHPKTVAEFLDEDAVNLCQMAYSMASKAAKRAS